MYLFKVRKEKERFFADVNSLGLFTISILEVHVRSSGLNRSIVFIPPFPAFVGYGSSRWFFIPLYLFLKRIYHFVFFFQQNTKDGERQNQYHVHTESNSMYEEGETSFFSVVGV